MKYFLIVLMVVIIISLSIYAWYSYEEQHNSLGYSQILAANIKAKTVPMAKNISAPVAMATPVINTTAIAGASAYHPTVVATATHLSEATLLASPQTLANAANIVTVFNNNSPDDVVKGCYILLQQLSNANLNYNDFTNTLSSLSNVKIALAPPSTLQVSGILSNILAGVNSGIINPAYVTISASDGYNKDTAQALWISLNNIYWGNIKGAIAQMNYIPSVKGYQKQSADLLNTAIGNYNYTNFANSVIALNNACLQELINETILQVDTLIYGSFTPGYTNLTAYMSDPQNHGGLPTLALGWERVKWQISNDNALVDVPYLYKTANGHVYHTDSRGLYLDDGLTNNSLTNYDGSKLYKAKDFKTQGEAVQNYMQQWSYSKSYMAQLANQSNWTQAQPFIQFVETTLLAFAGVPPLGIKAATQVTGYIH